jgi:YD repeat-containing protein
MNGNSKKAGRDAYGRLVTVLENNSGTYGTTTYAWNPNDTLATTTDADGSVRAFTYDGRGLRLTAQDLHDTADATFGTWTYSYDNAGNLISRVDPKSQTVNWTFDTLNRPSTEDYTGQAGTEVTYTYDSPCTDGVSRLCQAAMASATTTYTYNALGLVASETKTISSTGYATSYTSWISRSG